MATSAADIRADNSNDQKIFLANTVSTFFINGKPTVIYGLRTLGNTPS